MNEKRCIKAINMLCDFSFGTLWWVKDIVWKEAEPNFHLKNSKKKHPAICLGRREVCSLYQTLPMLLGSHSHSFGIYVNKLSEKKKSRDLRNGYFALRPYSIAVRHIIGNDPGISRNSYKPVLTDEEKIELIKKLQERGIYVK